MAVIVNGDGILTGVSSLTTALDDLTSGRGTITGVTTVGTLQLGTGVSISSPRSQSAAIFTNNTEFLTVDDAGRVGIAITNPTTKFDVNGTSKFQDDVTFTGASANITFDKSTDDLIFDDNAQAKFGTGGDLSIFHDGTNSILYNNTGQLALRGNEIRLTAKNTENYFVGTLSGAVELYHSNTKRFETTSTGVKTLGDVSFRTSANTQTILYDESDAQLEFIDNIKASFGTGSDLLIHHNGSANVIDAATSNPISFRYGGSEQFFIGNAEFKGGDDKKIKLGTHDDLQVYHDGSNSYLKAISGGTGDLYIFADGKNIYLRPKSGEDGVKIVPDGAVEIYHDANKKIVTTSQGAAIGQVSIIPTMDSFSCQIQAGNSGFLGNYHSGSNQQFIIGLNQYYQAGYRAPDNNVSQHLQLYNKQFNFLTAPAPGSDNAVVTSTKILTIDNDGVKFGADTAEVNALDDYEEGTFTPRLGPNISMSTIHENGVGRYTKIGNMVTCTMHWINKDGTAFPTNQTIRIANLPYAIKHVGDSTSAHYVAMSQMMYNIQFAQQHKHYFYSTHNSTYLTGLKSRDGTTWEDWSTADWNQSNIYLNTSITYMTTS